MSGLEGVIVDKGLGVVIAQVKALIAQGQDQQRPELERCLSYLDAVDLATTGLEREYKQLLVQAETTPLAVKASVQALFGRLMQYLEVHDLLGLLNDTIMAMKRIGDTLSGRVGADSPFSAKRVQLRRQAVEGLSRLIEDLERYAQELLEQTREEPIGVSGINRDALLGVVRFLEQQQNEMFNVEEAPESLRVTITQLRRNELPRRSVELTGRNAQVREDLITAFG